MTSHIYHGYYLRIGENLYLRPAEGGYRVDTNAWPPVTYKEAIEAVKRYKGKVFMCPLARRTLLIESIELIRASPN